MKIEDQVVSLELSRELKKTGYKQEGLWWWNKNSHTDKGDKAKFNLLQNKEEYCCFSCKSFVAPTVSELGRELPSWFEDKGIYIFNDCDQWFVQLRMYSFGKMIYDVNDEILANAMAKMWLYLKKENKL